MDDNPTPDAQPAAPDAGGPSRITNFRHVIVVIQENRTPDNLFQGLCAPPFGKSSVCSTTPTSGQYDIETHNWLDKHTTSGAIQPGKVPLAGDYDLGHSHTDWESMCDLAGGRCKMDGAASVKCGPATNCPPNPQFRYVDNSKGSVNPYLDLDRQARFAGAANADQCEQLARAQPPPQLKRCLFPTDEAGRWRRQVVVAPMGWGRLGS